MDLEHLLKHLPANFSPIDRDLIIKAYHHAEKAHEGQKRASGQPYLTHCVAVAVILCDLEVAPSLIVAGLLHDVVEDTPVTLEEIVKEYGEIVGKFVDGVTKLTSLPRISRGDQHEDELIPSHYREGYSSNRKAALIAETLRKTFLAMGDDVRVVLIKLADRLHNMRTLMHLPESQQKRIAQETLDIFAPLANRLGIWQVKWELEDLGFRYVNPEKYKEIAENLASTRGKREDEIQSIINKLELILKNAGIKAKISGRPKHIYSIYKKMLRKEQTFEMVRDLRGVRLIVDDNETCYKALGVVHQQWRPIPGDFDDYIAAMKPNNYQSLHTAVIYDDGKPLEVQIRTEEMHRKAEQGIAAHWRYKEGSSYISDDYEQKVSLLRSLMIWRQEVDDAQEFMDGMKSDVFRDRVYILTPRGDIVDLPAGSTPIDFAYHVHTNVGNRCRGAKVNGKLVTLDYALKTGDQIEILTAKRGGPSRDWLNVNLGLVKTSRARSKIKQWFKLQDREMNLSQGKIMLEKEFKRLGMKQVDLEILTKDFFVKSVDDLFVGIGCGDIPMGRVIKKIADLEKEDHEEEFKLTPLEPSKISHSEAITVMGLKGLATTPARCCSPMPGDEIIGYITRGRGATIHRSDCPNVLRVKEKERLIKVAWGRIEETFPVSVQIKAYDRQGLMSDISTVISNESVRLIDLDLKMNQHLANVNLIIEVAGIEQLSRLLTRIENLPNVLEARRSRPG
ncbi:MAG: bifunctional (p)ppGpp synthetase/guanosine-3',5'-bis(diphosphate) 3'-pyrophosphohydrolase [Anaerolineaceae bacterium]|nr:bifunctional (p)ppGpp synthetase/guanosine-3',5'-bis(diphosphate) 3'-pyrophosphohydrolase [Anaerolineaceae bacterium]